MPRRALLAMTMAVVVAGCSTQGPGAAPHTGSSTSPGRGPRTVFLGDSITAGYVAAGFLPDPEYSWVTYALADPASPWRSVANLAVPGETWSQIAAHYPTVARYEADQLVVMGGTNDVVLDVPREMSAEALGSLLERARDDGLATWVVAPPPLAPLQGWEIGPMRRLEQRLATAHGAVWVDATRAVAEADGTWREGMTTDGVHLSLRGARALGEAVAARVRAH